MSLSIEQEIRQLTAEGINRHEAITTAFEHGIANGRLSAGSRLPTVRKLSAELGVSGATVAAAYHLLKQRGWTRGEVGRGTFVVGQPNPVHNQFLNHVAASHQTQVMRAPWRRRAVLNSEARLRLAYTTALDCTSGKPDPSLFLSNIFLRSWCSVIEETIVADLQYSGPEPVPELALALKQRMDRDSIFTTGTGMVIGSSAQQLMVLSLSIVPTLTASASRLVAVEEPGYQTVFDAFEQMGFRLIGMRTDDQGVTPSALRAALAAGAQAALFTPRAQNPTGVSWTPGRRLELAHVLAEYPHAIAIEDDQFAELARARPGSLISDARLAERVVYIRSFAKSIAPDIRIAAAVARPRILSLLAEAKSFTDGWSPRMSQRALAKLLSDPELDEALDNSRDRYDRRRAAAKAILTENLGPVGGVVWGDDGLNLWIQFSPGIDASEVLARVASLGVLVTPGEPFYIRPGRNDVLRLSISGVDEADAIIAAQRLSEAVLSMAAGHMMAIPI